ncbi:MAG TPA: Sec-independent protein translocase TatB [Terrimesophilobacter sp.]|nr:Sec-independent protein translocase TatB [Terrimesophilobacter sp.]
MFGLTFEKLLLIGVIAVFVLGPDRLPYYASQLAKFVKGAKAFADSAKDRMREELGPDFDDVDWKKLDPRQYDPRRIIREALVEDAPTTQKRQIKSAYLERKKRLEEEGKQAPFDGEAT